MNKKKLRGGLFEISEEHQSKRVATKILIGIIMCFMFLTATGCQEQNTEVGSEGISIMDFDRENSINQTQEVLDTAESWKIEIMVNVLESVGVRGVIRAEFVEQPSGNLPTVPALEVESEDNRIYLLHLGGNGNIMTITDPEKGIIYTSINPMIVD